MLAISTTSITHSPSSFSIVHISPSIKLSPSNHEVESLMGSVALSPSIKSAPTRSLLSDLTEVDFVYKPAQARLITELDEEKFISEAELTALVDYEREPKLNSISEHNDVTEQWVDLFFEDSTQQQLDQKAVSVLFDKTAGQITKVKADDLYCDLKAAIERDAERDPMLEINTTICASLVKDSAKLTARIFNDHFTNVLLPAYIFSKITQIHYAFFTKDMPWDSEAKSKAKQALFQDILALEGSVSSEDRTKLETLIRTLPADYSVHQQGNYFKARKNSAQSFGDKRLNSTQLKTPNGRIFELVNTMSRSQYSEINTIMRGQMSSQLLLGEGGSGKVKFAYEPAANQYWAVKKIKDLKAAKREVECNEAVKDSRLFLQMTDFAHIFKGKKFYKSYIFLPLMAYGNGREFLNKNFVSLSLYNAASKAPAIKIVKSFIAPVAELHAQNIVHRDLKPENYMLTKNKSFKLADFGFADDGQKKPQDYFYDVVGTKGYLPKGYDAKVNTGRYHDNFTLGLITLEVLHGCPIDDIPNFKFPVQGKDIALKFEGPNKVCNGVDRKKLKLSKSQYSNLYDIAAGFLDADPKTQLTAEAAMKLPLFK